MMRRSRWTRPFAALFALWFAVILGDPGMLHSCPMHGAHGVHGGAHAAAAAGGGHDMAASHSMHGLHAAAEWDAPAQHGPQHHDKTGPCTCVAQCCVASVVAALPTVAATHVPATVASVEPPLHVAIGDVPASPDLRLPFANGPPAIA